MWIRTEHGTLVQDRAITRIRPLILRGPDAEWCVEATLANGATVPLCSADNEAEALILIDLIGHSLRAQPISSILADGERSRTGAAI